MEDFRWLGQTFHLIFQHRFILVISSTAMRLMCLKSHFTTKAFANQYEPICKNNNPLYLLVIKINNPVAKLRGIRKVQADAAHLLAYLGSLHIAQLHPNPLSPLQLQHNSHPSKTSPPHVLFQIRLPLKQFRAVMLLNTLTI